MLLRSFLPGGEPRARQIIELVRHLPAAEIDQSLQEVKERFVRHASQLDMMLAERFRQLRHLLPDGAELSVAQMLLIGGYFMNEYSLEAAALFNPSIVPHPDQTDVPDGSVRMIASLRGVGEGHISSIEFRTCMINEDGEISYQPTTGRVTSGKAKHCSHRRSDLVERLSALGFETDLLVESFQALPEEFDLPELEATLRDREWHPPSTLTWSTDVVGLKLRDAVVKVSSCDYELEFPDSSSVCERVMFPETPGERNGMEDARFVRFTELNGSRCYYGTYTAYDGIHIQPQLIETEDFLNFRVGPLEGTAATDKGMALFPRLIGGRYAMLGRQGGMNITLMFSDDVRRWDSFEILLKPQASWELVQIGNCGSPLETEAGWLVITHGVGAVRTYRIGAALLDLDDPSCVIGRLREPLLEPLCDESSGYVPNVVYSCGSYIHGSRLVMPFALNDSATSSASIPLSVLLERLTGSDRC